MLKKITLALGLSLLLGGCGAALAAAPPPLQQSAPAPKTAPRAVIAPALRAQPKRGSAPHEVAAHSPRMGLFIFLLVAALVVWMVLRRRAALMGYPRSNGDRPGGVPPPGQATGGYDPGRYPGGYAGGDEDD